MMFRTNFIIECLSSVTWTMMNLGFYLLIFQYTRSIGAGIDPSVPLDNQIRSAPPRSIPYPITESICPAVSWLRYASIANSVPNTLVADAAAGETPEPAAICQFSSFRAETSLFSNPLPE